MKKFDDRMYQIKTENKRHYIDVNKFNRLNDDDKRDVLYQYLKSKENELNSKEIWNIFDRFKTSSDVDKFVISVSYDRDDGILELYPCLDKDIIYNESNENVWNEFCLEHYDKLLLDVQNKYNIGAKHVDDLNYS